MLHRTKLCIILYICNVNILFGVYKMANASANQSKKSFFNPFENFANMPNFMDFGNLRQQYSKNIEALTHANQVALEFSKDAARRAAEVMQKSAQQMYECSREAMSGKSLEEAQNKQANMMLEVMNDAFNHAKESADISSKAAKEILDTCNKRLSEVISETYSK